MSVIAKLYSIILNYRLLSWTDNSHVFDANQFGFQARKSTTDCFKIQSIISKILSIGNKLYRAFVHYRKIYLLLSTLLCPMYFSFQWCHMYMLQRSSCIDTYVYVVINVYTNISW